MRGLAEEGELRLPAQRKSTFKKSLAVTSGGGTRAQAL
jgi:hypothetical protein